MQKQSEDRFVELVVEIRNWIRAAAHGSVRASLEIALPDEKSRTAYQMFDGSASIEQVRTACKMSPNAVVALASRCVAAGLMDVADDKRRKRLFDLSHFDMLSEKSNGDSVR